jgi:general secretion pathway protein E
MPEKPTRAHLEVETELTGCLQTQGYDVSKDAKITGKSGIEHAFQYIARLDDGLISSMIAVCIADREKNNISDILFNFANKAFDAGIQERLVLGVPDLADSEIQLAQKWRMKVISIKQLESLCSNGLKPKPQTKSPTILEFETKEKMVEALKARGYRVEENTKIVGRSGVEYVFDVLAYIGTEWFGHSLGIDFLNGLEAVGLDSVSSFDTKAYDTGIDSKILVVKPRLSPAAKQLAEQQRIRVFENVPPGEPTVSDNAKKILETLAVKPKSNLKLTPQTEGLQLIPEVIARRYNAIPLSVSATTMELAMANPADIFAMEAIAAISRKRIKPVAADAKDVRDAIDFNYKGYSEIEKQVAFIPASKGDDDKVDIDSANYTPLVQAVNMIIEEAAKARASDIHLEPEENRFRVRYRIDGALHDMMSLPLNIHKPLISRLKIMADLNIADSHHPQDGQFGINAKGRQMDIRLATVPTVWGEMAVLRLLDKSMAIMKLSDLGMMPDSLAKYENLLKVPYGMIMVIGPTGSGKTTTLYASINMLDAQKNNIITVEDPAEYHLKDINQIQINTQAGLTFASGLKSILRLDPNVSMVGEIRDGETASIAVQSAMTGHLMLTTLHANDTTGALTRLIDLGVEPFLAASSVIGVVSQRMVRRLCPDCQRVTEAPVLEQTIYEKETGEKKSRFPYGSGCKTCSYTGYRGRVGILKFSSSAIASA